MKNPKFEDNVFGHRLRELRKRRGLSMDEMVDRLNQQTGADYSKSAISLWENGKREPFASTIKMLAAFFDVSPAYLMGMTDDENEPIKEPEIPDDEYLAAMHRTFLRLSVSGRVKLLAYALDLLDEEGKA